MSIPNPPHIFDEEEKIVLANLKRNILAGDFSEFKRFLEVQDPALQPKFIRALCEQKDDNNQTIFHILAAQKKGQEAEILDYLLSNLSSPDSLYFQDKKGQTALHIASKNTNAQMIFSMIQYDKQHRLMQQEDTQGKTAFDLQDRLGRTIYHRLIRQGESELLQFLLTEPILHSPYPPKGVYIQNNKGRTPLHIAAKTQHPDIMHALLAFEPLILTPDKKDVLPVTLGVQRSAMQRDAFNQTPTSPAIKLLWEATPEEYRPRFKQATKKIKRKKITTIPASKQAEAYIRSDQRRVSKLSKEDEQLFASAEFVYHVLADRKDEAGNELTEGAELSILSDTGETIRYIYHPIVHEHGLTGFALTPASGVGEIKIGFRGTKDKAGVGRDLSPVAAGHDAFSRKKHAILERINEIVGQEVQRLNEAQLDTQIAVSVGGHSLGGADAQSAMTLLLEGMCVANKGHVPEKFSRSQTEHLQHIQNLRLQALNAPGVAKDVVWRAEHAAKQLKKLAPEKQISAYYQRVRRDAVNVAGQGHLFTQNVAASIVNVKALKFKDYHFYHTKAAHTQKQFNQTIKGREHNFLKREVVDLLSNQPGGQSKLKAEFSGYKEYRNKAYHTLKKGLQRAWNTCFISTAKPVSNLPNVTPLKRIQNVNTVLHKRKITEVTFTLGNDNRAKFLGNEQNLFRAVQHCGDAELVKARYRLVVPMVDNNLEATKQKARDILASNQQGIQLDCVLINGEKYDLELKKLAEPAWPPTVIYTKVPKAFETSDSLALPKPPSIPPKPV